MRCRHPAWAWPRARRPGTCLVPSRQQTQCQGNQRMVDAEHPHQETIDTNTTACFVGVLSEVQFLARSAHIDPNTFSKVTARAVDSDRCISFWRFFVEPFLKQPTVNLHPRDYRMGDLATIQVHADLITDDTERGRAVQFCHNALSIRSAWLAVNLI